MKEIKNTPLWVTLVYASVHTRRMALMLVLSCVLLTVYCIPWVQFSKNTWVAKLFLLGDWSWFSMMIPMVIWYWVALKWVDKHAGWEA